MGKRDALLADLQGFLLECGQEMLVVEPESGAGKRPLGVLIQKIDFQAPKGKLQIYPERNLAILSQRNLTAYRPRFHIVEALVRGWAPA